MTAGACGYVQQSGGDVHFSDEQPGAQAVGPGGLPLPEAPGALAQRPAGPPGLLLLLAEEGTTNLLLARSFLLSTGLSCCGVLSTCRRAEVKAHASA